jgi:hypothetical protein
MNSIDLVNLPSDPSEGGPYGLFLAAHGFESRATAVPAKVAGRALIRIALGFDHNHVLSYPDNDDWFRSNGFVPRPNLSAAKFSIVVEQALAEAVNTRSAQSGGEPINVAVDVSCFDRHRLAIILDQIWRLGAAHPIQVDFWYCIADFQRPSSTLGRNEVAGPIHCRFAGHFADPGRPLALVAGLGYEIGKVVGAAEYLQASRVIALFPESPVPEYEPEVNKANKLLLQDIRSSDIIRYAVSDCRKTVATLDSVVRGLRDTYNVVMLPGGPKIFVLASLITQRMHQQTSVWRVSSGASIAPRNVHSSGHFVGVQLVLRPVLAGTP